MSLVTTPTRQVASCPACTSRRVTDISMTLTDGSIVGFLSCHRCEHKTWTQSGRLLDVATVLVKAKKYKTMPLAG